MNQLEEIIKKFREEFKCIQSDCAGGGHTMPTNEEPEGGQCQFCFEYLFSIEQFLRTTYPAYAKELMKKEKENFLKVTKEY